MKYDLWLEMRENCARNVSKTMNRWRNVCRKQSVKQTEDEESKTIHTVGCKTKQDTYVKESMQKTHCETSNRWGIMSNVQSWMQNKIGTKLSYGYQYIVRNTIYRMHMTEWGFNDAHWAHMVDRGFGEAHDGMECGCALWNQKFSTKEQGKLGWVTLWIFPNQHLGMLAIAWHNWHCSL